VKLFEIIGVGTAPDCKIVNLFEDQYRFFGIALNCEIHQL